jgi:2-aminoadipate transaminase
LLDEQAANGRKPAFIYTTASYQNPTGTSQPVERRQRLLELARQHQILIVEDDTYADITFEPQRAPAIYSLAKPGEVLYIGSFSKILGPGVRLGFFIADESIIARLLPWKMDGGTSMLSQMIAAEYFKDHLWDHIEEGRQAVKDKRNALLDSLESEFGSVPGMSWTRPDGGLFLWITLPPEIDRVRLQQLATDAGIVYSTGQAFNATNQDVPNIRLAFGWIEREDIPEAIRTLASCVRAAMPARVAP